MDSDGQLSLPAACKPTFDVQSVHDSLKQAELLGHYAGKQATSDNLCYVRFRCLKPEFQRTQPEIFSCTLRRLLPSSLPNGLCSR